jgi:phosphoribosyl 1,2-cyclic phosphodiesterase
MKFISLGSGSSGNCYLLQSGETSILLDVGISMRSLKKHLKECDISLENDISAVFVTHDHADHIKSVGSMSADFSLPIYATREVHAGINRNYCVTKKVSQDLACYVEKGKTITLGDFQVTPFGVPHDSTDNVGYFIEAGGTDFCLITDAGMVTDEMKPFICRAHHLVIEANHDEEMVMNGPYPQFLKERILSGTGHLSNRSCGEAIVQNMSEDLKRVWLCHLSEENNHPELARKTVESILRSYGIVAGADLQLEVLKRNSPTGPYELE